ncbi:MAG: PSD1 and planctomycete cytochrome C domain-containing protein [Planctomycetaceae bacterium]|nr:PSD1 and planctomycete cytochrome C domain-containing protein [Planctomycetaceae bacterium]
MKNRWLWISTIVFFCIRPEISADEVFFESKVRPLLVKHCYKCHRGKTTEGGLALDSRLGWQKGGDSGPAIVPGKPEESLLMTAVNGSNPDLQMPPGDADDKLNDGELEILKQWIAAGAFDPRTMTEELEGMSLDEAKSWWAFQPLPQVEMRASSEPIDALIDQVLALQQITATSRADKRTLIRRVTYDLTGLPPTPEQVQAFLSDDSPDAFSKVVDRLLDSPQYGVKWGRHWLDVVRYADTAGENTDRPLPHAWRYRNWVFDAFNRDLPYDQFVSLQIAGDRLRQNASATEQNEGVIATGYLAIARRFGHDIDQDIHLMHEDVIDNLGKSFLGLTISCARCHDHKYDPISAKDYYALYGIFQSTRFPFPGCEAKGQPRDLVPLIAGIEQTLIANNIQQRLDLEAKAQSQISESSKRLSQSKVAEGGSVLLAADQSENLQQVRVRKGEVLLLKVLPNEGHGADTTLVEWEITEVEGNRSWNLSAVIPTLLHGNPNVSENGTWCFLYFTDGRPRFLTEKYPTVEQRSELQSWSTGETPSVLVNRSDQDVGVWTKLPPTSFFVHPGPKDPVGIAWIAPVDTVVNVTGRVADAHPSGLDGVTFELSHVTSPEVGGFLLALGEIGAVPGSESGSIVPVAYAVVEGSPQNASLHQRGDPEKPGDVVPRSWLSMFGGEPISTETGSGREDLAEWITQHPLFARVMVNRIWQGHFVQGLSTTPNDFGSRGNRPTQLQLLNWLAAQFQANGYSIKAMHRLILNSQAYQRSCQQEMALVEEDVINRYLSRFERRRLSAEEIRDSLLFVAQRLDLSIDGAHPFPPESSWKFTQHDPFNAVYESNRRSAYLMVQRQRRHPYLALFDGADPNSSTATRQVTTVPTQALYFFNDPFFHSQAAAFAINLKSLQSDEQRINNAFQKLYQREPTMTEMERTVHFLQEYPGNFDEKWSALIRVLMASNEFLYLD